MKYFSDITTGEELKKEFRTLCQTMHPDKGGNAQEFAEMLNEYESALKNAGAWTKEARAQVDEWAQFLATVKDVQGNGDNIKAGDRVKLYDLGDHGQGARFQIRDFMTYTIYNTEYAEPHDIAEKLARRETFAEVQNVITMTDAEFDAFDWFNSTPAGCCNGGTRGPIMDNEPRCKNGWYTESESEHEHYYNIVTLVKTPTRCAFLDPQGYDYTRYIYLPLNVTTWAEWAEEETAARDAFNAKKEEERKAEERRKAFEAAEILKWSKVLEVLPPLPPYSWETRKEHQKAERAQGAAFKRNIKAIFSHYFPGVKCKVTNSGRAYCESSVISWVDGPTVAEVEAVAEFRRFLSWYAETDSQTDYYARRSSSIWNEWREKFGAFTDDNITFSRELSEANREKARAVIVETLPQFAGGDEQTADYTDGLKIAEYLGKYKGAGVDWLTLTEDERKEFDKFNDEHDDERRHIVRRVESSNYYGEKTDIDYIIALFAEYWVLTPQEAPKADRKTATASAAVENVAEGETIAEGDGVQLIAIDKGAKLTGNTYNHKDEIKTRGARWYRLGQCWTIKAEQVADFAELVNSWNESAPQAEEEPQSEPETAEEVPTMSAEDIDALRTLKEENERKEQERAEAVARLAVAFADLCQTLEEVAKAQKAEAEKAAKKAARAQEVETLRENIATMSAALATMGEQLRKMSDRLAELTDEDSEPTEPQPTAPDEGGKAATGDTLHDAEEISDTTATAEPCAPFADTREEAKARGDYWRDITHNTQTGQGFPTYAPICNESKNTPAELWAYLLTLQEGGEIRALCKYYDLSGVLTYRYITNKTAKQLQAVKRTEGQAWRNFADHLEDLKTWAHNVQEGEAYEVGAVWQFDRFHGEESEELHEIRKRSGCFDLVVNICDSNGGGMRFPDKFPTYAAALEALHRFRPGVREIATPCDELRRKTA